MGVKLIATGSYYPKTCVHNSDLAQIMDTSDEWIQQRTGIQTRYISVDEQTSTLGAKAALNALQKANLQPEQLDFIIVATMSGDYISPSTACIIQQKIGATNAFATDVNAACSGFIYALHMAEKLMRDRNMTYGLVIGAEVMSKIIDWTDRTTAVLFGDGAGCVVLQQSSENHYLAGQLFSKGELCALNAGHLPIVNPLQPSQQENRNELLHCTHTTDHENRPLTPLTSNELTSNGLMMNGRDIFNFATRQIPKMIQSALEQQRLTVDDIDYFVCHQANSRIIDVFAKKLNVTMDKFPINVNRFGNTSAASIPILLDELYAKGLLPQHATKKVMCIGFGGGLTWGYAILSL